MSIPFTQLSAILKQHKKKTGRKGTTIVPGLRRSPTASETHPGDPRFQQRLSLSTGEKRKGERDSQRNVGHDPDVSADLDGDGNVGVEDLLDLVSQWGECPGCPGDLNGDGVVDVEDLLILIGQWGDGPPPTPEQIMSLISSNSAEGAGFRGVTSGLVYEQNNFAMSFGDFVNRMKKKSKVRGVTGLPTFSYNDPRFQQRLKLTQDEDEERERRTERGQQPCPPYCDPPHRPTPCRGPNCGPDEPDEPDEPDCLWGITPEGECADPPDPPDPTRGRQGIPHGVGVDPRPEPIDVQRVHIGPEGTIDSDDLFDPWKYRGGTNMHSLYYKDK